MHVALAWLAWLALSWDILLALCMLVPGTSPHPPGMRHTLQGKFLLSLTHLPSGTTMLHCLQGEEAGTGGTCLHACPSPTPFPTFTACHHQHLHTQAWKTGGGSLLSS